MKKLGQVTKEECDEIRLLFQRNNALKELFMTLNNRNDEAANNLYEKIVTDISKTSESMRLWWSKTAEKYSWSYLPEDTWHIEFDTCFVYIDTRDEK